jgi:glycosyltransferase involved in cell wall biosynthesis
MGWDEAQSRSDGGQARARLRLLHVVVQATPTNSQWNEHCLPVADERQITVCSLFPASVPGDRRIARFEGDGSVLGGLKALRRALREDRYDAVHVHAAAAVPVLLAAYALDWRWPHDVVFTLHNCWPNQRPRNRVLAAVAMATFPVVVACSHSAAESIPKPVRRLARRGIDIIPNGVDVARVDRVRAALPVLGERGGRRRGSGLTMVTVGRLIPIKDQTVLLDAFARVAGPDDRLVVVGEGPLRHSLDNRARELGVHDRVSLLGLISRDEVYRVLATADVYVSPSQGEGLPVAVLEAMAVGLPVVLSDIPPHREIVAGSDAAQLVKVGDVDGLAAAMSRLRAIDHDQRSTLGARGRQLVLDELSLGSMAQGYHGIYSRVSARARLSVRSTA